MKQGGFSKPKALIITLCVTAVLCGAAAVTTILKNYRPYRESGSSKLSPLSSSAETSSQEQWSGNFSNFLFCGIDNTKNLTDVILLVGFNNKTKKITIMQIPRDTYVSGDVPTNKYNAVYGHHDKGECGMETLRSQIEKDFGIRISNYAAVTTEGFKNIVDAVGGVDVDVPINMNYDDDSQNLHIHLKKGMQHLDGSEAEQFVRYRKGWLEGDLGRLKAQKSFIAALADKLKSLSVLQLTTKVLPVLSEPDFVTDLSTYEMLKLRSSASQVKLSDAEIYTMPGESYRSKSGAAFYSVHKKDLLEILNKGFVPEGVKLTLDDLKIVEKSNKFESSSTANGTSSSLQSILNKQ